MDLYNDYYDAQIGGGGGGARTGYGGISHVYVGSPNQRGHGIGSFLGGLFRRILPLLKQGARTVGKEALRTGTNIASDVLNAGIHPREAFKTRLRESGQNLKRKAEEKIDTFMRGSGYKVAKIARPMHSTVGRVSRRIKPRIKRKNFSVVKKKKKKTTVTRNKKKKTKPVKRNKTKKKKKLRSVVDIFA